MFPDMITRLHSTQIDVADLETATRDYTRMLGAPPTRRERSEASGRGSAFFGLANMALELRGTEGDPEGQLGQAGIRLAWEGDDPVSLLASRGLEIGAGEAFVGSAGEGVSDRTGIDYSVPAEASRGIPVALIREEKPALIETMGEPSEVDPAARVRSLDHVVVMSADADATRSFYLDGLGLRLALDKTFEKRGVRLLFFRVGGTTIEIGARIGVDPKPGATDRFGGLAWQVPDIDAVQARLAADRFDVSEVRTGHKEGTRVCTVRDPVHGVPTLLIEPVGTREERA